jgi:predicted GIY-YIG superfamily endonuclease
MAQSAPFYTYIVASRSLTLYIGMTGSLRKRLFEHKRKLYEGFAATYNWIVSCGTKHSSIQAIQLRARSN